MTTYTPDESTARITVAVETTLRRRTIRSITRQQLRAARSAGLALRHEEKEQHMAEKAKRDPFEPWLNGMTYDQALDGNVWTLTKGEDFDQATSTVAAKLRGEFERRYGSLDLKVEGDVVHVRCTPPKR